MICNILAFYIVLGLKKMFVQCYPGFKVLNVPKSNIGILIDIALIIEWEE